MPRSRGRACRAARGVGRIVTRADPDRDDDVLIGELHEAIDSSGWAAIKCGIAATTRAPKRNSQSASRRAQRVLEPVAREAHAADGSATGAQKILGLGRGRHVARGSMNIRTPTSCSSGAAKAAGVRDRSSTDRRSRICRSCPVSRAARSRGRSGRSSRPRCDRRSRCRNARCARRAASLVSTTPTPMLSSHRVAG
jgi:hypothetical protein